MIRIYRPVEIKMRRGLHFVLAFTAFCLMVSCLFGCSSKLSSADVFDHVKYSVAEVKADDSEQVTSYGTAVCLENNLFITNAHVIFSEESGKPRPYDSIFLRMYQDGDYLPARIIRYDIEKDLCLLEVPTTKEGFVPVSIADSESVSAGQKVYAVGNAMNHGIGITEGIVSIPLINLSVDGLVRAAIQCDITIAGGNSGGGLFDEEGELVGMTSFRIRDNKGEVVYGIGFAIPSEILMLFSGLIG